MEPVSNGSGQPNGRPNGHSNGENGSKVWTTLLTNRGYFGGLLVLNHTLKKHGSKYPLVVMVTEAVDQDEDFKAAFEAAQIPIIVVEKIEPAPRDGKVNRGTWEKLKPWGLTQFEVRVMECAHGGGTAIRRVSNG